ncbi:MAG: hypothetical protein JWO82_2701, partial [Akkermansiaceae bacterium]|nr:hypothetical protein [Akkermansiaceae bacterium]
MFDEVRLERLVSAYFDGQLTAEEKRELEAMLLGSSAARRIFLDHAEWHGLLREHALQSGGASLLQNAPAPVSGRVVFFRRMALGIGLAACLILAWKLLPSGNEASPPGVPAVVVREDVALLAQAINVEWDGVAFAPGAALPKGLLKIRQGTLRLDFYSGARVILEGPAALELISPGLARLERGRLTANVPPPAAGFTIQNGSLSVIDRGTEFGMNVTDPNDCEVHVFNGEVELKGEVPPSTPRELFGGNAVAIRDGRSTAFPADRESFPDSALIRKEEERAAKVQLEQWRTTSSDLRRAPGLRVYFDFDDLKAGGTSLPNRAEEGGKGSSGSIIGCEPLSGRWPGKSALGFAKSSDRVRFRTDGVCSSLTLVAWVRVDSLPLDHNSLLSMAPGRVGEVHWKFDRSGRLLIGLRAAPELAYDSWERLVSDPVVTPEDFGHWLHLATVIDGERGEMRHFVNGKPVA